MLADQKGSVVPEWIGKYGRLRNGKVEVDFNDMDSILQEALLEARSASTYGAESSDNLVAEIHSRWWETLGTRVGMNPNQRFALDLVGDKGTRREAVATGFVVGNKIKQLDRVEGVIVNANEIKAPVNELSVAEGRYDGRVSPRSLDQQSSAMLLERGCPQKLVDDLNEIFRRYYNSEGDGVFRFDGVFVNPKSKDYVLRGGVDVKSGVGWRTDAVEIHYKKNLEA